MTTAESSFPKAVLFDLDGTLLDSAADFLFTVNQMREARDLAPITLDVLRPFVSRGARAMLGAAFADVAQEVREAWLPEFLGIYQGQIGQHGRTFPGIEPLLAALEASGTVWGIVTNKPEYLAREIVPQLGWERRSAVLVGGDTFPVKKPHPLPLLMAAERIGIAASQCVYVGDDQRDIVAARAAGMRSVAVLWGYRSADDDPADWGADVLVTAPECLLDAAAWPA